MRFDLKQIGELADLANEKGLAEVTVEDGDQKITLKLPSAGTVIAAPVVQHAPAAAVATAPSPPAVTPTAKDDHLHQITAPMVGTFYASPSPESPAYVAVGASVSKGQTLCIIEAMKMMNELESEVSGKIVKVLAENSQPVEFGQPLFLVDTHV